MNKYFKLMRIHHYIKNILIFVPMVFNGQLLNINLLAQAAFGFTAFCFLSSAVYIFNDIHDLDRDRQHSTKCNRPVASGAVSIGKARGLAIVLLILTAVFNFLSCGTNNIISWVIILAYFGLNIGYSLGLKNVVMVDIAILVSGFMLRLLYGSTITGIEISKWLYLTVMSMSFFLSLGKRRNELAGEEASSRKVLEYYNHEFLDKNMYICLAVTIAFYSLWSVDALTVERVGSTNLVWTVPLVILICMKYSLNIEGESDGDPVEVFLNDRTLMVLVGLFCIMTTVIFI